MSALGPTEELDQARVLEAERQILGECGAVSNLTHRIAIRAVQLAREGWTPTDPDLTEARALVVDDQQYRAAAVGWLNDVTAGRQDQTFAVRLALAAIKRGRELARDGANQCP